MRIFTSCKEISAYLESQTALGLSTGFVPTMGALHNGHLALIKQAKQEVDLVICSIFVNPLQFNRKEDLDNYPNRLVQDREMLELEECDVLFTPTKEELYPEEPEMKFAFGSIGMGMEAEHRPNHFEGVAAVINRFFEVLNPTKAYFGEKDYQQLAIIRWLVEEKNFNTLVVGCKTVRYESGLAMSSRNYRLSQNDLETAADIYSLLNYCKENYPSIGPKELSEHCFKELQSKFEPEYFIIADESNLSPIESWSEAKSPRAFVAAYLSGVRLIDNLSLKH